jgi:glucose-6-phosphate 1-dehydrogenase
MKIKTPTTLVIFGATGDLARTKLFPALYSMFNKGMLTRDFRIVGFSRSQLTNLEFRKVISSALEVHVEKFANLARYQSGLFEDAPAYKNLGKLLLEIDDEFGACSSKLFYLGVAPKYYKTILENLSNSGLTIPCSDGDGWTRVLVEKPFGEDAKAAMDLDNSLAKLFHEEQIFRIDHYLARETMQNILSFRFSNAIFEPLWSNKHIDRVEIKLLEKDGVGERGTFYDEIGALRDVGQNHLLQMLALVAMGHPQKLKAEQIRRERTKVLEALREIKVSQVSKFSKRAQYDGFRKLVGVGEDSTTETYFRVEAYINNARWSGVPFYLESGKGLNEDRVEINVYFKAVSPCLCPPPHEDHVHQNMLSFAVKPREEIVIRFWTKKPGVDFEIEPRILAFRHEGDSASQTRSEAYEKVLFDCIAGEQMLFASSGEVAAAWRFTMPILRGWQKDRQGLLFYKKGTRPEEITKL